MSFQHVKTTQRLVKIIYINHTDTVDYGQQGRVRNTLSLNTNWKSASNCEVAPNT